MPPETSDWEIFAEVSEKKRQGKKGENWEEKKEKKENCEKEGEKLELEVGKIIIRGEDFFFFFFFFFAFHFWKRRKFVLGLPKSEFFYREKTFHVGKNDFAPSEKYACYAPG